MTCKYTVSTTDASGAIVHFEGEEPSATAARAAVHELLGMDKPEAPAKTGEQKNVQKAGTGVKSSPAEPTQTASGNSANSSTESSQASSADTTQDSVAEGKELDYAADIKPLILEISKTDKAKAVALLQRFGASNGQQLKPTQYPDFHRDAQRVLAGEYDPTASDDGAVA